MNFLLTFCTGFNVCNLLDQIQAGHPSYITIGAVICGLIGIIFT